MWADNETDIDLLGFDFLVDSLVVALTEPRLLPLTVGVLGDWGSGKSSLMRIAKNELSAPREEGPSKYLTVDFSPWQFEDYEDVKIALMNSVLDALEKRAPAEQADRISRLRKFVGRFKRWGRWLGRVGTAAAPTILPVVLQTIDPSVGPEAANIMKAATTVFATEADRALAGSDEPGDGASQNVPLTDIARFRADFTTLVEAIPETDAVIVFIDDLDRCLPETVVDTFEAILRTTLIDLDKTWSKADIQPLIWKTASTFNTYPEARAIFGQVRPRISIEEIVDAGKILIVNAPTGIVGEEVSDLLCTLVAIRVRLACHRRAAVAEHKRRFHALYIDEASHIESGALTRLITESRSFRLGACLISQTMAYFSRELQTSIDVNVGTRLRTFHAEGSRWLEVNRLTGDEPIFFPHPGPMPMVDEARVERIRTRSRELYGAPLRLVEPLVLAEEDELSAPITATGESAPRPRRQGKPKQPQPTLTIVEGEADVVDEE